MHNNILAKKKKTSLLRVLGLLFLIFIASSLVIYYITNVLHRPEFVRYPAFGIDIPTKYEIHGIDVSRHQDVIEWNGVKNMEVKNIRIGFVFIKATEGLGNVDPQFRRNWLYADKQGIAKGAYHFFIAGKSGKLQAANFIQTVNLQQGDLPPVCDIEQVYGHTKADVQAEVKDFVTEMEKHYGVKPIIYTNVDFYNNYLAGLFDDYPLWVAHYLQHDKPRINRKWVFWQHSEEGRVDGIANPVDFNVFAGDSSDFNDLLIK